MKTFAEGKACYKFNLVNLLKSPAFYIICLLYLLAIPLNFFLRHQFFTKGSSDLTLFFSDIPYICILIIPSLCYKQNYSIYEAFIPLSSFNRIGARFLAVNTIFLLMNLLLLPCIFFINLFMQLDAGQVFTSYIILTAYGLAVSGLCIFINEIISNKIASFIINAVFLAIINSAHLAALYLPLGNLLTHTIKEISFAWHFNSASKGVLDSRDFFWLLGSSIAFLLLAAIFYDKKRGKVFSKAEILRNTGKIILVFLIMMNTNHWYKRLDLSRDKLFSLSAYTKSLVSKIDNPVKITYYRSQALERLKPQIQDVSDYLSSYSNASSKISYTIKNPDKNTSISELLQNYGIQSQPLRSISSNSTEYTSVFSAIVIEYQGLSDFIPFTMDAASLEYDLDQRLQRLLSGSKRYAQIILGNGLSIYEDYSYLVPWLNSQGFECNVLDIKSASFSEQLLSLNGPLFVIGDSELPVEKAIAIEDYILRGNGNALLAVSPYSSNIDDNWHISQNKKTNIVEMIENWGISFEAQIAADISCARITMLSDDSSQTQLLNYPMWLSLLPQENAKEGADLFWATPLTLREQNNKDDDFSTKAFLVTSQAAYAYDLDMQSPQSLIENNPFIISSDSTVSDKKKGTLIVGALAEGKLPGLFNLNKADNAKVIVIPDQYFVNTLMQQYLGEENDLKNFQLLTEILLSLNNEEELANLHSKNLPYSKRNRR